MSLVASWCVSALAGCADEPAGVARVFDPCAPIGVVAPGASAAQQASVDRALALWTSAGVAGPVRVDDGADAAISIAFRSAAPSIYGFYDDASATVYVNSGLDDDAQRAITIAHELGHAMGLGHVDVAARVSVMNAGNLTIAPAAGDVDALAAIWGACGDAPP